MRISDWSSDVCSSDLLEDERGLDLVQLAVAHGGDGVPARARGHLFGTELLAAPRAQDDVRRAPHHFGRVLQDARLRQRRSEEHTSELQSLMRISYADFCLKTNKPHIPITLLAPY